MTRLRMINRPFSVNYDIFKIPMKQLLVNLRKNMKTNDFLLKFETNFPIVEKNILLELTSHYSFRSSI